MWLRIFPFVEWGFRPQYNSAWQPCLGCHRVHRSKRQHREECQTDLCRRYIFFWLSISQGEFCETIHGRNLRSFIEVFFGRDPFRSLVLKELDVGKARRDKNLYPGSHKDISMKRPITPDPCFPEQKYWALLRCCWLIEPLTRIPATIAKRTISEFVDCERRNAHEVMSEDSQKHDAWY